MRVKLLTEHHLEFLSLKCHIVENHMLRLIMLSVNTITEVKICNQLDDSIISTTSEFFTIQ